MLEHGVLDKMISVFHINQRGVAQFFEEYFRVFTENKDLVMN